MTQGKLEDHRSLKNKAKKSNPSVQNDQLLAIYWHGKVIPDMLFGVAERFYLVLPWPPT
jgi:hypothetical protein